MIGVDAGHGGTNKGAFGITGIMEKDMTLLVAKELQQLLEAEGAKVIMTRTKDTTYDSHDRYLLFKETNPDVLVSIHLNSSADPVRIKGVSTYYKHIGYRSLSQKILHRCWIWGWVSLAMWGILILYSTVLQSSPMCWWKHCSSLTLKMKPMYSMLHTENRWLKKL